MDDFLEGGAVLGLFCGYVYMAGRTLRGLQVALSPGYQSFGDRLWPVALFITQGHLGFAAAGFFLSDEDSVLRYVLTGFFLFTPVSAVVIWKLLRFTDRAQEKIRSKGGGLSGMYDLPGFAKASSDSGSPSPSAFAGAPQRDDPVCICESHLEKVGLALMAYRIQHGVFPTSLSELCGASGNITDLQIFLCPSSGREIPEDAYRGDVSGIASWGSYDYAPPPTNKEAGRVSLCWDKEPCHAKMGRGAYHLEGRNVLFADGHVEYVPGHTLPGGNEESGAQDPSDSVLPSS